jgi:hypothetical protein
MRKIQFETRTHQGGSKKIFRFIFLASPANFGQLYVKHTPSEILNLWHVLHSPLNVSLCTLCAEQEQAFALCLMEA